MVERSRRGRGLFCIILLESFGSRSPRELNKKYKAGSPRFLYGLLSKLGLHGVIEKP